MKMTMRLLALSVTLAISAQAYAMDGEKDIPQISYQNACTILNINPDMPLHDLTRKLYAGDIDKNSSDYQKAFLVIQKIAGYHANGAEVVHSEKFVEHSGWFKKRVQVCDEVSWRKNHVPRKKTIREYYTHRYNYPRIIAVATLGLTGLVATGYWIWKKFFLYK